MPSDPPRGLSVRGNFEARQQKYFQDPDSDRFLWQTRQLYVAERERALLPRIDPAVTNPFLEVGCGEGANLYHLSQDPATSRKMWVGADLFFGKVLHAVRQVGIARAVCADGQHLPFLDARFSHVFSRDLFHHVLDKDILMAELRRVCAPGGTITLIEANGRNPIIWLFGLLRRAERDVMTMCPEVLLGLLGPDAGMARVEFFEPFPLYRIVFHYRYGFSRLAHWPWCRRAISRLERWMGRLLPEDRWGYIRATVRMPLAPPGS